jgi:hypothetical protein
MPLLQQSQKEGRNLCSKKWKGEIKSFGGRKSKEFGSVMGLIDHDEVNILLVLCLDYFFISRALRMD